MAISAFRFEGWFISRNLFDGKTSDKNQMEIPQAAVDLYYETYPYQIVQLKVLLRLSLVALARRYPLRKILSTVGLKEQFKYYTECC